MAKKKLPSQLPRYSDLIRPTFKALQELGGSGRNNEILNQIIDDMKYPDTTVTYPHKGSDTKSELSYQADWARTYLRKYGIIENSDRGVWTIKSSYTDISPEQLDVKKSCKWSETAEHQRNPKRTP